MDMSIASTPFVHVDAARVRRNIDKLATYAASKGIGIRPHTKTHKSVKLAQMQLDAGAVGLTVAKVGEAEVMAQTGADLLLAYPAVDMARTLRIARLAGENSVRVAVDSIEVAQSLYATANSAGTIVGILVDLDVGMGRTGVQSPAAALELAQQIEQLPGLHVSGLFCYPGHVWTSPGEQAASFEPVSQRLAEAIELFKGAGLDTGIVSGGSTPTAYQSHLLPQITEIRPGTYIFNDMNTVHGGYASLDDCAATVVATVVSTAVPGQVVVDAGSKTLTTDRCIPALDTGHGHVIEYPQAKITALSEEHGQIDITACDQPPKIGERISIIPNHICPCVNLHNKLWWDEGEGQLEAINVDARGKLS